MSDPSVLQKVSAMLKRLNVKHDLVNKKKLCSSTLYRALAKGKTGDQCPAKKGPRTKISRVLLEAAAKHTEVSQCGDGELRGRDIKRAIGATVMRTRLDGAFQIESVWKKVKMEYPETFQAAKCLAVDDSCAQWTTFENLQQWFEDEKRDIIGTGLVLDREVRDSYGELVSELDFRSDDVRRRIVDMDETHHDLSITGDRSGPRAVSYHNKSLQRRRK